MSHIPGKFDVITDLRRAIFASLAKDGFKSKSYKGFLANAEKILKSIEPTQTRFGQIENELSKARNTDLSEEKRRENLLMAANLIS